MVENRGARPGTNGRHPRGDHSHVGRSRATGQKWQAGGRDRLRPRLQQANDAQFVSARRGEPAVSRRHRPEGARRIRVARSNAIDGRFDHRAGRPGDDAARGAAVDDRPRVRNDRRSDGLHPGQHVAKDVSQLRSHRQDLGRSPGRPSDRTKARKSRRTKRPPAAARSIAARCVIRFWCPAIR